MRFALPAEQAPPRTISKQNEARPAQEHGDRFRYWGSRLDRLEQDVNRARRDEDELLDAPWTVQSKERVVERSIGHALRAPGESVVAGARVDVEILAGLHGADLELDAAKNRAPKIDANEFPRVDLVHAATRARRILADAHTILVATVLLAEKKARIAS